MIKTWQQRCEEHPDHDGIVSEAMIRQRMQEEIDELRQALAQPEQEPIGYAHVEDLKREHHDFWVNRQQGVNEVPLYAALPKKQWVGLSDEEIKTIWGSYFSRGLEFAKAIEAKLKEKNCE